MAVNSELKATRDGYGEALLQLGKTNPKVFALSADLADSTRAVGFRDAYPNRYIEVGIAEQNLIGVASGLSIVGCIPFASSFGCFMIRAADHIRVTVAYGNLNVKIVTTHNGVTTGEDGASAQMMEDLGYFLSLPNMTVVVPADANQAYLATLAAATHVGPLYLRLGREPMPSVTSKDDAFEIGKAHVLREGNDVTIVACGSMVAQALKAASSLQLQGISARVMNLHTLKPLDEAVLKTAAETGALVTAEEHQRFGGLGSLVAQAVAKHHPIPIEYVAMPDTFGKSGRGRELMETYGLTAQAIAEAARRVIHRR